MAMKYKYTSAMRSFDIAVQYFKRLFSFVLCVKKNKTKRGLQVNFLF
jgi:hypothetical protein